MEEEYDPRQRAVSSRNTPSINSTMAPVASAISGITVASANVLATMGRLEAKNLIPSTPQYDAAKNFLRLAVAVNVGDIKQGVASFEGRQHRGGALTLCVGRAGPARSRSAM